MSQHILVSTHLRPGFSTESSESSLKPAGQAHVNPSVNFPSTGRPSRSIQSALDAQSLSPVSHSFTATQGSQLFPSPKNPSLQRHSKFPTRSWQVALGSQVTSEQSSLLKKFSSNPLTSQATQTLLEK